MPASPTRAEATERLPNFCSAPILFALLLVAALTVCVIALAPGAHLSWTRFSSGFAFTVWLAIVVGVVLCKARPMLLRLPGWSTFAGVWITIIVLVAIASSIVAWLDHALDMRLTPGTGVHFVLATTALSALIGAALLRYFYVIAQWQARQAASARAQVEALQARIRPHFLFNSMNTVAALVRVDPGAAEATIEHVSELFRAALNTEGSSTLGQELELVDSYLAVEQLRLGERLHIERDWRELPLALPLPRLLLQPLVENAIVHGIAPLREGGTLSLHGRTDDAGVTLVIGNPLAPDDPAGGNGVGLDNVRQRLAYHFGKTAHLSVQQRDGRFELTLALPRGS